MIQTAERSQALRLGLRLEAVTVVWMAAEAAVAIGAGIGARSVLLTGFGSDSLIELISGGLLLWRLDAERRAAAQQHIDRAEARAAWLSASLLCLLCLYLFVVSVGGVVLQVRPSGSVAGLAVAGVALGAMALLWLGKRRANAILQSSALRADIAQTVCCAYLAVVTVAGVAVNTVLGWWWADYVGALILLFWLVREAREAVAGAREGRLRCDCD